MKKLRYILLIVFLVISVRAYPASFSCGDDKAIVKKLLEFGCAYAATAIEDHGFVTQLFVNMHTGDWIITGIDKDMKACILMRGVDFESAVQRGA